MINHARTLLLNRSGYPAGFVNRPGEEFISPDFRALTGLPRYITALHHVLFGISPDWLYENYRVRQYMSLLHSTELVEFVLQLDPRITYDTANSDMFQGVFGVTANNEGIRFIGELPVPDADGRAVGRWRVTVLDDETVSIEKLLVGQSPVEHSYTAEGNWSTLVPLGSDKFFVTFDPTPDLKWEVTQHLRPQRSLGEIVASLEQSTRMYWNDLFGVGTPLAEAEPMKTFRNLWLNHHELPYRLGGLLLALVWRTEQRRNHDAT